jgi:hypothetical protein
MADVFIKYAPFLRMYTGYVNNYEVHCAMTLYSSGCVRKDFFCIGVLLRVVGLENLLHAQRVATQLQIPAVHGEGTF